MPHSECQHSQAVSSALAHDRIGAMTNHTVQSELLGQNKARK